MKRNFAAAAQDGQAALSLDVMAVLLSTSMVLAFAFFDVNLSLYYEKALQAIHGIL